MLHSSVPCPPGVRAGRRGAHTPQKPELLRDCRKIAHKRTEVTELPRESPLRKGWEQSEVEV